MATEVSAELLAQIDAALAADKVIEAIRLYRVATQADLLSGRRFVEARRSMLEPVRAVPPTVPAPVQRYLDSGHARRGELFGYWRNARRDWCVLVMFQRQPQALFELGVFAETIAHWGHDLGGRTATVDDLRGALSTGGFAGAEWGDDAHATAQLRARLRALLPRIAAPPAVAGSVTPSRTAIRVLDGPRFERDWLYLPVRVDGDWWQLRAARAVSEQALAGGSLPLTDVESGKVWPQAAGPLLWSLCCSDCSIASMQAGAADTLFSDLEAQPPNWEALAPAVQMAWFELLLLVDVSTHRRSALPWWLQALAAERSASVGLLGPAAARLLSRHAPELRRLFAENRLLDDINSILELAGTAAADSHWLVGWEPGT